MKEDEEKGIRAMGGAIAVILFGARCACWNESDDDSFGVRIVDGSV